ncbi:NADPH-dependent cytochrome P450 oxidoreductase [Gongronella butleri]|nr:NADPH-dependent cytochrome P450 oxidoreductase [Gongronella butleri]
MLKQSIPEHQLMLLLGTVAMGSLVWMTKDRLFNYPAQPAPLADKHIAQSDDNSAKDDSKNFVKVMIDQGRKVVILYGSQTGTAEDFAQRLGKECKKRLGVAAMVVDFEEADLRYLDQLPSDCLAVFVVSTYGEGDPPDSCVDAWELLNKDKVLFSQQSSDDEPLTGMRYFMFGLGNSTYEFFNGAARDLDKHLSGLGARRIGDRGEGDDDVSLEDDFVHWQQQFFPLLQAELGDAMIDHADAPNTPILAYKVKNVCADDNDEFFYAGELGDRAQNTYDSKKPYPARVNMRDLTPLADNGRHCLHIEVELPKGMTYMTGDHLGVWPTNNEQQIALLCRLFGWDNARLDQIIHISPNDPTAKLPFPARTTLRACLRHYLDIAQLPSRATIDELVPFVSDALQAFLRSILDDKTKYQQLVLDDVRNLGELLAFGLGNDAVIEGALKDVPLAAILEAFGRLQPRYYSISSSSSESPNKVTLTAVTLQYQAANRTVYGVNTNYMWSMHQAIEQGTIECDMYALQGPRNAYLDNQLVPRLPVHVRASTFRLPTDTSVPIIMIGPGTGVAPFRGFVRERVHQKNQGNNVGPTMLFFGCRNADKDFLYKDEWNDLFAQLDDSHMINAFSRDGDQKVYVQHRVAEHGNRVWDLLNKGAYLFICGDAAQMAKSVANALIQLAITHGGMDEPTATQFFQDMRAKGKYQEDVWA